MDLNSVQFKLSDLPDMHQVEAIHPEHGRIGEMQWVKPESADDMLMEPGEVYNLKVHKDFRGKGVGRQMWNTAKSTGTPLAHSYVRSDDGRGFSAAVGD